MMIPSGAVRTAVAAVLAGLLGACGSGTSGTPVPAGPPETGQAGSSYTPPAVFKVDACTMVPEDVLEDIEFTEPGTGTFEPGTPEEELSGNRCTWKRGYSSTMLTIVITEGAPGAGRPADGTPPVESILDGRKTVRYTEKSQGGSLGTCSTTIVVSPEVKVVVQMDGTDTLDGLCAKVDTVLPSVSAKIPA